MTIIMEGSAKGNGAPGGVDQGTMEIIEEDEHQIPKTQAFTPTPSNDDEVQDVPLPETFVHVWKKVQILLLLPQKMFLANYTWFLAK
jgi:hypothetical protein